MMSRHRLVLFEPPSHQFNRPLPYALPFKRKFHISIWRVNEYMLDMVVRSTCPSTSCPMDWKLLAHIEGGHPYREESRRQPETSAGPLCALRGRYQEGLFSPTGHCLDRAGE